MIVTKANVLVGMSLLCGDGHLGGLHIVANQEREEILIEATSGYIAGRLLLRGQDVEEDVNTVAVFTKDQLSELARCKDNTVLIHNDGETRIPGRGVTLMATLQPINGFPKIANVVPDPRDAGAPAENHLNLNLTVLQMFHKVRAKLQGEGPGRCCEVKLEFGASRLSPVRVTFPKITGFDCVIMPLRGD